MISELTERLRILSQQATEAQSQGQAIALILEEFREVARKLDEEINEAELAAARASVAEFRDLWISAQVESTRIRFEVDRVAKYYRSCEADAEAMEKRVRRDSEGALRLRENRQIYHLVANVMERILQEKVS